MQRLGQSTRVEHHERNLGTGMITLENGVKVTGLGELSYGLAFTQIIVRTVEHHNAVPYTMHHPC